MNYYLPGTPTSDLALMNQITLDELENIRTFNWPSCSIGEGPLLRPGPAALMGSALDVCPDGIDSCVISFSSDMPEIYERPDGTRIQAHDGMGNLVAGGLRAGERQLTPVEVASMLAEVRASQLELLGQSDEENREHLPYVIQMKPEPGLSMEVGGYSGPGVTMEENLPPNSLPPHPPLHETAPMGHESVAYSISLEMPQRQPPTEEGDLKNLRRAFKTLHEIFRELHSCDCGVGNEAIFLGKLRKLAEDFKEGLDVGEEAPF